MLKWGGGGGGVFQNGIHAHVTCGALSVSTYRTIDQNISHCFVSLVRVHLVISKVTTFFSYTLRAIT